MKYYQRFWFFLIFLISSDIQWIEMSCGGDVSIKYAHCGEPFHEFHAIEMEMSNFNSAAEIHQLILCV